MCPFMLYNELNVVNKTLNMIIIKALRIFILGFNHKNYPLFWQF